MSVCLHLLSPILSGSAPPRAKPLVTIQEGDIQALGCLAIFPSEIIYLILRQLPPIDRAVCGRFNRFFFHAVEATFKKKSTVINALFSLQLAKAFDDKGVTTVAHRFPTASDVELVTTAITAEALHNLAINLRFIDRFVLRSPPLDGFNNIQSGAFLALVKAHPEITHLCLSRCPQLKSEEIKKAIGLCKTLVELSLNSDQLEPKLIKAIVRRHPNLERLTLASAQKVDDRTLHVIATKCTKLQFLIIHGCEKVSRKGLQSLLSLPELTSLTLDGCKETSSLFQLMMKRQIPRLRSYHFYEIEE